MKATRKIIDKANRITAKYSKWLTPKELQSMYNELEALGITVGMISNKCEWCEWYLNGEEVENSYFIYKVYEGDGDKNEYLIYFS